MEYAAAFEKLKSDPTPPWRLVSSRELAKTLGVSLQTLANWRVRGTGPQPQPLRRGTGNRIFYKRSDVLAWLSSQLGKPRPVWHFFAEWLNQNGLEIDPFEQSRTERAIAAVECLV